MNNYNKSNILQELITGKNGSITCAKFSKLESNKVISGDNENYTHIFKIDSNMPIITFGGPGSGSGDHDFVTAVDFFNKINSKEPLAFSGTFRGTINVYNLRSCKVVAKLLGHTTQVTCFSSIYSDDLRKDILVSGSCDTSVKVWDLGNNQCLNTLRGHGGQVNDVRISPDGAWIASCSNDKSVIIWEIISGKQLHTFNLHSAPVTCIRFNPQELALACSGHEKSVTYYDLENSGNVLAKTQKEANQVECIEFDPDGKYVFTASQNSLKVWDIEKEGRLKNKYDVKWKGVLDLKVGEQDKKLYGISATANEFIVWVTDWSESPISPPTFDSGVMNPNQNIYNIQSKVPKQRIIGESRVNTVDDDLRMSKMHGSQISVDQLKSVRQEHRKFTDLMKMKYDHLKPIIYWLNNGNISAAVNAIDGLEDPAVIMDLLNMMICTSKIDNVNIDFSTTLIKKARSLIASNYMIHIRIGLKFVLKCISKFSDEIIKAKSGNIMNKVDIAREQRIKNYDLFLNELNNISRSKRLKKIRDRYSSEEVGKLCKSCLGDIDFLIKKSSS